MEIVFRGAYAYYLQHYLTWFNRDQILILNANLLKTNPAKLLIETQGNANFKKIRSVPYDRSGEFAPEHPGGNRTVTENQILKRNRGGNRGPDIGSGRSLPNGGPLELGGHLGRVPTL